MKIPLLGLGTWELKGKACEKAVKWALELGYTHIDTAHVYDNHRAIGHAISQVPREKLFLTSKFTIEQLRTLSVEETLDLALKELGVEYLDLYLLHYPDESAPLKEILQDLVKIKKKARFVGVSNFTYEQLKKALKWGYNFAANQVEFHPYYYQDKLLDLCNQHDIALISYRTLGKGALLLDPIVNHMGAKYGKTAAQILLRWCTQKNVAVIPKASTQEHLRENVESFSFNLEDEDMLVLDNIPTEVHFCDF